MLLMGETGLFPYITLYYLAFAVAPAAAESLASVGHTRVYCQRI